MSRAWMALVMAGCGVALATGCAPQAAAALLESGAGAVKLWLVLLGTMPLWSGLMEILRETGDVERLGRCMRKGLAFLFPGLKDEACWSAMGMNLAANILGLGNAATPAGIRAAQLLEKQGRAGLNALAMLLALNNSSLQLMPTTVITLRAAAGAAHPADIWPATLVSSGVATVVAAVLMRLACARGKQHE